MLPLLDILVLALIVSVSGKMDGLNGGALEAKAEREWAQMDEEKREWWRSCVRDVWTSMQAHVGPETKVKEINL